MNTIKKIALALALGCAVAFAVMSQSAQAAPAQISKSAGCSSSSVLAAHPGRDVTLSLKVGDIERSYLLHLPRSYRSHVATALVLAFHGHNNTASIFERESGFSLLSNRFDFIIAYPQGAVGPDGQTGWNTGRTSGPRIDPTTDDLAFTDALVAHLEATFCINESRVYATGFSNGGGFVAILACQRASLFTAVGIVAGDYYPQPSGCNPSRAISILEIHGTSDEINPYRGSSLLDLPPVQSWLTDWATRDGCTSGPAITMPRARVMTLKWSDCARGVVILHNELQGVGHTWPNGSRSTDYFNAASAIWAFF